MRQIIMASMLAILAAAAISPAVADDWTAVKLRGYVLVNDIHGTGAWTRLKRGDVVSDDSPIRTMSSGNVEFTRATETIAFGPNTSAQIIDRTGKRFTTVVEQFGSVSVSAEVRNVRHFAVQTPYLVAVVKGTEFIVDTGKTGSQVTVTRGLVGVAGLGQRKMVLVAAGQHAVQRASGSLTVTGTADQAATHPTINGVTEDSGMDDTAADAANGDSTGLVGGLLTTTGNVVGDAGTTVTGVVGGVTNLAGGVVGGTTGVLGKTLHGLGL